MFIGTSDLRAGGAVQWEQNQEIKGGNIRGREERPAHLQSVDRGPGPFHRVPPAILPETLRLSLLSPFIDSLSSILDMMILP